MHGIKTEKTLMACRVVISIYLHRANTDGYRDGAKHFIMPIVQGRAR